MSDQTIILLVVGGTLAALSFAGSQLEAHPAKRQHSLRTKLEPASKEKSLPTLSDWNHRLVPLGNCSATRPA